MNIELSSSPKPTREDGTAYGEVETRDHSDANELTGLTPDGATTALSMSYDAAGNLLSREIEGGSGTVTMHLTVYRGVGDAWNRLEAVEYGTAERLKQSYNGLNWRVLKWSDATHGAAGELTQRRAMYYSPNWQLLEELIDDNWNSESGAEDHTRRMLYIWGARYIDDIVARRQTDPLGTHEPGVTTSTWYHVTDTLFSTVAILSRSGTLVERVSYDAYGNARHHRRADLTGDGAVNVFDNNTLLDDWQDYGVGDLNRDGIVNETDLSQLLNDWGAAIPSGRLTPQGSSGTDNIVGYAGYLFNAEIHGSGLYTVRHRHYSPELGRWISRDPIGYVDGMSLYEYVSGTPLVRLDFMGLHFTDPNDPDCGCGIYDPRSRFDEWLGCLFGCRRGQKGIQNCRAACGRRFEDGSGQWFLCVDACRRAKDPSGVCVGRYNTCMGDCQARASTCSKNVTLKTAIVGTLAVACAKTVVGGVVLGAATLVVAVDGAVKCRRSTHICTDYCECMMDACVDNRVAQCGVYRDPHGPTRWSETPPRF